MLAKGLGPCVLQGHGKGLLRIHTGWSLSAWEWPAVFSCPG